jgi:hypothetical protein
MQPIWRDAVLKTKPSKNMLKKVLRIPGICQAAVLVKQYAYIFAFYEIKDLAERGELGDEIRRVMASQNDDSLDRILKDRNVSSYFADSKDEWLEDLSLEAGPKIAELWNLTNAAGDALAFWIYLPHESEATRAIRLILSNPVTEELVQLESNLLAKNVLLDLVDAIKPNHIYLDVTELTYSELRAAYQAISFCRRRLGMDRQDLREGAPSTINTEKAIQAAHLVAKGVPRKKAALECGFKIYTKDNPSGSYPLFRKYEKLGTDIEQKLAKLEEFLCEAGKCLKPELSRSSDT